MLGNQHFAEEITKVGTEQLHALGSERSLTEAELRAWTGAPADSGEAVAVYVQNDATAAAAWAIGNVIGRLAGVNPWQGILNPVAAPRTRAIGVAQHAIASGSYGWILKRGVGEVLTGAAGCSANTALKQSAAGGETGVMVDLAAIIDGQELAYAMEADAVGSALVTAYIDIG